MLRVVLIDDEPLVIEGLMEMIDWQDFGFKVTGVANDGISGLELIKELGPDLIITDIRMPELDGLKMIEQCQKQMNKEMCFLVLSGYNDFDYIKTAMDLKSLSYILKPIDPDEIHNELKRIKAYFDQQQVQAKRLSENIALITTTTLNRIVDEPGKKSLVERAMFLMNLTQEMTYSCGIIQLSNEQRSYQSLIEMCQSFELSMNFFYPSKEYQYFIVYGTEDKMTEFLIRKEIFQMINNDELGITGVLSKPIHDMFEINNVLKSLLVRMKLTFYDRVNDELLDYKCVQEYSKDLSLFDGLELARNIEKMDKAELDHYINCLFRTIRQAKLDPHLLKMRWENFLEVIEKKYQKYYILENFISFCEFKEVCKRAIAYYYDMDRAVEHLPTTQKIKDYIAENIESDLRLKSVASIFGYNSVYLGQLFFKENNIKYNDYVMSMRIQKAKKLLLNSDKSIKEIALTIGFNNPDYFLLKFKEFEGTLPSRYRL